MPNTKLFLDIVNLGSGHSLIAGHLPPCIELAQAMETIAELKMIENEERAKSFGFFGDTPNYNTYYPDVKPEELIPDNAEFVYPTFRLLSKTILTPKSIPLDFTKGNILKSSMPMIVGQSVHADHEMGVGNALGSVESVMWQQGYKLGKFDIPAGINGRFKIDGKSNPRIARGLNMEPPSIHSNSLTVSFLWSKSHPELDDGDFWVGLGKFGKDKELIRKIVEEIENYHETSLVNRGRDGYAQILDKSGKIRQPLYADQRAKFSLADTHNKVIYHFIDYKKILCSETLSFDNNAERTIPNSFINKQTSSKMDKVKEILMFLSLSLGLKVEDITEENYQVELGKILDKLKIDAGSSESLKAQVTQLGKDLKKAKPDNFDEITNQSDSWVEQVTNFRKEVKANYTKLKGKEVEENVNAIIDAADHGTLITLNTGYLKDLDEKFPMSCKDCNSTNLSRSVADPEVSGADEKGGDQKVILSKEDTMKVIRIKKSEERLGLKSETEEK